VTAPQAGLSQLLRDLESPLEQVRQAALEALERFPALSKLRALRRAATTDPSVTLRLEARRQLEAAVRELGAVDAPVERLQALLGAPEAGLRVKAIRGLAVSLDPRVPALLAEVLGREREPFVLAAALQALAATAGRAAISSIFPYLSETDARLRATAVEALEATGDPGALTHLLPLLEDPHHRVRAMAARAVQAHDPEAVLACVDAMLADPQEMTVRSAAFVLRFFQEGFAVARLREKLADARPGVVAMALASLQHMGRSGSVKATQLLARVRTGEAAPVPAGMASTESPVSAPLEERLASPDAAQRLAAVRETVRNGREDMMDRLRTLLEHEGDARVLATVVAAAGLLGNREDVRFLRAHLDAPDARLRANAVEAVGLLSKVRKARLLAGHLTDANNRVRANAVVALHGCEGIDAMPVLREMASSHDSRHAVSAVWAAATIATPASVQVLAALLDASDADVASRAKKALEELAPVLPEASAVLANWQAAAAQGGEVAPAPAPVAPPAPADPDLERELFDLRHESPSVRQEAARRLAARGDPALLASVRPLLRDDDPTVRRAAREAARALVARVAPGKSSPAELGKFEELLARSPETARQALDGVLDVALVCGMAATAEAIVARLPEERAPFVRASLITALALVGDRAAVPVLEELARDPDARVRANAVDALELLGGAQDARAAIERLSDPDPRVRAAAITASLALYREPFLSHLRGMLFSEAMAERAAGLYALQAVLIPERAELLREYLLAETQPRLYESAADALVKELSGNVAELDKLAAELPEGDKKRHVERCARRLTEGYTSPTPDAAASQTFETLTELSHLLDLKKSGELSVEVLRHELSREKDPLAVSFLLEEAAESRVADFVELAQPFTHSKDRRIRLAAVEALGKLGTPDASEAIAFLVRDRDPEVSRRAMERLEKLAPEAALAGVRALLETAHSWAVTRGLELLERRGDPATLPLALSALALGGDPALVEPLTRLVKAWGSEATLDELGRMYRDAPLPDRPLLKELGAAVVEARALSPDLLAAQFPADAAPAPAATTSRTMPRAARSRAIPRVAMPRAPEPRGGWDAFQLAGSMGVMLLVLVGIAAMSRTSAPPPLPDGRIITSEQPEVRTIEMATAGAPAQVDAPAATSAGGDMVIPPPTLAEVKALLKRAFAAKGIKSDAILQLMALDRYQTGYRADVARAREAASRGSFDQALSILEGALASVEPDHVVARMLILRASEIIAREAGRFELLPKIREMLAQTQKGLIATLQKAAREGDIPEDKLKAVIARLEKQDKERAHTRRASDWLSGADVEKEGPLEDLGGG
jgi:HEAT repeat protein